MEQVGVCCYVDSPAEWWALTPSWEGRTSVKETKSINFSLSLSLEKVLAVPPKDLFGALSGAGQALFCAEKCEIDPRLDPCLVRHVQKHVGWE